MRLLATLLVAVCVPMVLSAAEAGRVFFMSFDGLGHQMLHQDPVGKELRTIHKLVRAGAEADGLMPAFPSTTANSHAALWTGAYAGLNGILYNRNPILPRSEHTFLERGNGFRSDSLTAEPVWLTAARQHVNVVAHQVTQAYPFARQTAGEGPLPGFVMLNGYQSRSFSPWRALRKADVRSMPCEAWTATAPGARSCFAWSVSTGAGDIQLFGALAQNSMLIGTAQGRADVRVRNVATEMVAPRKRGLARHWSAPLEVHGLPDNTPASLVFRLFEMDSKTGEFLLLQGPIQESALLADGKTDVELARRLVRETGPMAGNGALGMYTSGAFGKVLHEGGDGTAERRYLESVEWVIRQQIAQSNWLFRQRNPRLHITYLPFPDETDHTWLGLERAGNGAYLEFRRWAYIGVERGAQALVALAGSRDHIVITSDHGMAPVFRSVAVNVAMQEAGVGADTSLVNTCMLLNTRDWKGGAVASEDKAAKLSAVVSALKAIRDEQGQAVVTKVYSGHAELKAFGLNGPSGADICFDLAPGTGISESTSGPVMTKPPNPRGVHGFDPTRADMHAVLVVRGPRARPLSTLGVLRSTTVAPLVCDLLGIDAPAQSREVSPLPSRSTSARTESQ